MIFSIHDFDSYLDNKMSVICKRGELLLKEDIMHRPHYVTGLMLLDVHTEPLGRYSFAITTDPVAPSNGFHYAPLVRDGRGPVHVYPPKRALKFTINGQTLFRQAVKGYKGDSGFPKRAAERLRAEISHL